MNVFKFEFKKLFTRKLIWFFISLSIFAIVGIYSLNWILTTNVEKQGLTYYDQQINWWMQDIQYWATEKEKAMEAEDEALIEEATLMEDDARSRHQRYSDLKEAYKNGEWSNIYKGNLEGLEILAYPPPDQPSGSSFEEQPISNFTLRASYEEIKYLLEHNIDSFGSKSPDSMFLPTIYDDFSGNTLEKWEESTKRYSKQGIYFFYQLIQSFYIPIVILVGCFIFGNTLSLETTKKRPNLQFYKTLPINQSKLFLVKYLTGYLGVFLFLLLMIAIPILVGTIIGGFGDLDYPVLVYDGYTTEYMEVNAVEDTFHFITLQEYLIRTFLFTVFMSLFIYSIYYFISQFIKEPIFNVILVGLIVFGVTLIQHPYNPLSYLDMDKVLTNEVQLQLLNTDYTYITGLIVNIVLSIIFIWTNFITFKVKKDKT
ncbi:hypothetical conserved protein [Oceanobacillus iheyensis HTE831]|uniref:Hypothetical conserved protein n=1 Tax=Oceanobacillus iheyensis (strain DSM 14371 / CIP 107618 / JCM 11309 / KCTC 3954 / HTE831) TaxID=221109 RepID=Q8ETI7_OCEIH|nr:ABC transporter permease [Oceanobacillus iheyensis]BAC12229.1 hypothetical conserved protein [Oceanobacillus iheyensis HTE831]